MASAVSGAPLRVPKLAVRNRDTGVANDRKADAPSTLGYTHSRGVASHNSTRNADALSQADDDRDRPFSNRLSRTQSNESSHSGTRSTASKTKHKAAGVLGFLALKEPSTSALEEFAQQQKLLAAKKGGRTSVVGLPGVSSQKLPAHVPKVNSKWDGLPDSISRSNSKAKKSSRLIAAPSMQSLRLSWRSDSSGEYAAAPSSGHSTGRPEARRPSVALSDEIQRLSLSGETAPSRTSHNSQERLSSDYHISMQSSRSNASLTTRVSSPQSDLSGDDLSLSRVPELQSSAASSESGFSPVPSPGSPASNSCDFAYSNPSPQAFDTKLSWQLSSAHSASRKSPLTNFDEGITHGSEVSGNYSVHSHDSVAGRGHQRNFSRPTTCHTPSESALHGTSLPRTTTTYRARG